MVQKYQSPVRVYKHPFELVMAAYEKRFPTCDMIPVFVGCDILNEEESEDKATHTVERRCKLNVNAPFILKRVAGCEYVYFVQKNALNRRERTLKISAYNESFSSRIVVKEFCEYSVHPDNSDWTCFEQSATLEVKSFFGFENMVEKIAIKQYTANIKKGKEIIEHYLTELQSQGVNYIATWAEQNPHLMGDSAVEGSGDVEDETDSQREGESGSGRAGSSDAHGSNERIRGADANLDEDYIEHNLGMLNPIEESTLIQLRMWLSDTHNGKIPRDEHILRFLRSRDFNMEKTREILCQSLSWRKQHQIDRLLDSYVPCETLQQYYLGGWHHHDHEGRPVYVLKLGQMDTKGVLKAVGEEKILRHILCIMEEGLKRCQELSALKKKKLMCSWTCIVDLEGLSMRHLWRPGIQALLRFIELIESNYPETMARLLMVRAPRVFPVLWALLNPFIDEKTTSKFMMYTGTDYLRPGGLIDYIPEEYIPDFLGGSCECNIPVGGPVPKSLYRKEWENRENGELWEDTIYERANLFKGMPHEVVVKVPEKEGVITWDFDSIRGDLLFTLYYSNKDIFDAHEERGISTNNSSVTPGGGPQNSQMIPKNFVLDEDFSVVETGIVCREGESVQGSHVASDAGCYILQWKWAGAAGSNQSSTVQDVFDQVTHSAKAKLIYYHELLPSQNFKGSMTSLESCQSAFSSLTIASR